MRYISLSISAFFIIFNADSFSPHTRRPRTMASEAFKPSEGSDASAHQQQTRRLVGAMMKLTGMSASGLAKSAGLTPSTINRFMHKPVTHTLSQRTMLALMTETFITIKGRSKQSLNSDALAELAPAIAVYERGILELAPDVKITLAEAKAAIGPGARRGLMPEPGIAADLPVLIVSTQGVNILAGNFTRAPLTTQRPPFLEGDARAFAILMPDETMTPRYDAGDMLYASPARTLEGDTVDVILERAGGGFVIGSLAGITSDTVRLGTLSPRARESYARDKVRGIHRIVGVQRLGG